MPRQFLFSVTLADCEVQTFTVGGHGGSGKDTSNTGVRIIHHPSGARGECREHRSQLQNKRAAMRRLGESRSFKLWAKLQAAGKHFARIESAVEAALDPRFVRVEVKDEKGRWVPLVEEEPS